MIAAQPAQQRVLAHATHELRGAFANVELCLAGAESRGREAELAGLVEAVRAQIQRGMTAVEDVEAFLARGSLRAAREPVELGALVERRQRAWSRLAELSGATMEIDWQAAGALVLGDARRLCQALDNLVSNAIAHGGGEIELRSRASGSRLALELSDGGSGPSRDAIAASIKLHARHGHGLAIARLAIEACGGRIEALDDGVAVELPLHDPADRPARVGEPSAA